MRNDKLKSHKKKHERGHKDNIVTKGVYDVKTEDNIVTYGQQISCTDEELENEEININKEFNRKIELGQNLKLIVDKHGFNENGVDNELKEALKT